MNYRNLSTAMLICFAAFCHGQKQNKPFSELYLTPHLGMSWQSTLFKPDFSGIYEFDLTGFPYFYDRNTQGFGLDVGLTAATNTGGHFKIGIKTNGRLRYDYLYGDMESGFYLEEYRNTYKSVLFDFYTALFFAFYAKRNPEKEWTGEIGVTINQMGKTAVFLPLNTTQYVRFRYQYTSVNFGLGYDIVKLNDRLYLNTTLYMNYIPYDFPGSRYPAHSFMTLGIKASVRFKAGKIQLGNGASDRSYKPKLLRNKD